MRSFALARQQPGLKKLKKITQWLFWRFKMKTIEDTRLEELRKFLIGPTQMRTPEELTFIARDLIWVIEAEQLRRVNERRTVTLPPKPHLLFGSDEAVLRFVEEQKLDNDRWKHLTKKDDFNLLMPRQYIGVKLEGADEDLWNEWLELKKMYSSSEVAA